MFRTSCGSWVVVIVAAAVLVAADDPKTEPVRKLTVKVGLHELGKVTATRGVTTFHSLKEVEKSLGEGISKQIAGQMDFSKEDLVVIGWAKAGPPFVKLEYEVKDEKDGRVVRFYLQQPKPSRVHGNVAMRVTDFFVVAKGTKVEFGRQAPGKAKDENADETKAVEFKGTLRTGIMAIGGETTGTIIRVKGGKSYELELGNLRDMAEKLNGKEVVVQGTLRVTPGVEIKERRIITVTELRAADAQQDTPAAPKGEGSEAKGEKRQLLSNHETLAVFDGLNYRQCMGRTALCPDRCGHSGEFATFTVKKYLKYEKLGQYGDPKQDSFLVQVSDFNKKPKGDPKILETVTGLRKGDYVLLSWHHDYVTKEGASYPERPIVKLEAISKEKAEELMSASAKSGTNEKESPNQ